MYSLVKRHLGVFFAKKHLLKPIYNSLKPYDYSFTEAHLRYTSQVMTRTNFPLYLGNYSCQGFRLKGILFPSMMKDSQPKGRKTAPISAPLNPSFLRRKEGFAISRYRKVRGHLSNDNGEDAPHPKTDSQRNCPKMGPRIGEGKKQATSPRA